LFLILLASPIDFIESVSAKQGLKKIYSLHPFDSSIFISGFGSIVIGISVIAKGVR
jgi:hypothetical protein